MNMSRAQFNLKANATDDKDMASRVQSILGGSIGNLVEWYDWYAYAAFAIYFSGSFFPNDNATAQLLNTAGVFALGFLMRPIWRMDVWEHC